MKKEYKEFSDFQFDLENLMKEIKKDRELLYELYSDKNFDAGKFNIEKDKYMLTYKAELIEILEKHFMIEIDQTIKF